MTRSHRLTAGAAVLLLLGVAALIVCGSCGWAGRTPSATPVPREACYAYRGQGRTLWLLPDAAVLRWDQASAGTPPKVLSMRWEGGRNDTRPDPSGRRAAGRGGGFVAVAEEGTAKPLVYACVQYEAVYPGIDLVFHAGERQVEYDVVVHPGASPEAVRLVFDGADDIRLSEDGELVLMVGGEELRQSAPVLFQEGEQESEFVSGAFVLRGDGRLGFAVAPYDTSRPLVIDPVLSWWPALEQTGVAP